jgi:thiol:disulfide interchange protein DsbC
VRGFTIKKSIHNAQKELHVKKKLLAIALGLSFILGGSTAMAAGQKQVQSGLIEAKILADLKQKYPKNTVSSVTKAPMGNLYEVVMGQNIGYVDPDTKYVMFGHIFDMAEQHDITQDRVETLSRIDFSTLPLEKAIKVVKGDGSRSFAVFTDPECPYCSQLERNLLEVDNYTMYVFLYHIAELHPNSRAKADAIWCAADKAKAWSEFMIEHKEAESVNCTTPLDQIASVGQSLGVQGTPTLIHSDGRRAPGALPVPALDDWLGSKAPVKGK